MELDATKKVQSCTYQAKKWNKHSITTLDKRGGPFYSVFQNKQGGGGDFFEILASMYGPRPYGP